MIKKKRSQEKKPKNPKAFLRVRVLWISMLYAAFTLIVAILIATICIRMYQTQMTALNQRSNNIMAAEITHRSEQENDGDLDLDYALYVMDQRRLAGGMHSYLFDVDGNCVQYSCGKLLQQEEIRLPQEMLYKIEQDGVYRSTQAYGLDYTDHDIVLTTGLPLHLTNAKGVTTTYYLFINGRLDSLNAYVWRIWINAALIWAVATVLFTVLLYYFMKGNLEPVFAIQEAAERYAKGDFSQRLRPEEIPNEEESQFACHINMIADNVARAEEQRKQFVSNVSHELRTPMTIISGYIDGILDGTVPKGKRTQYLNIVSQEMQRLKMLISSMLNLSKFDNGTISMNYQTFSLNDIAFRTILMFESRLEKKEISVEGLDSDTVHAYGDPDWMGQVIYNLVENAVKFVNTKGTITFTFLEEPESTVFAIRNTGAGIDRDDLPKIFDRFYKTDASRSADKTGLGLGLDITRHIIRLHQGQISVSSEKNEFTEFRIQIPKEKVVERAKKAAQQPAESTPKTK